MNKVLMLAGALFFAATLAPPIGAEPLNPAAIVQFGPTTEFSTLMCPNFTKTSDGSWLAVRPDQFGLGFVQNIVPPTRPIKVGSYVYNNIDLYSQLEYQCAASIAVRARY